MRQSILLLVLFLSVIAKGQFGGNTTYEFLNLTSSARVNALGGNQVGLIDSAEVSLSFYNPATLRADMHNRLSLNYVDYFKDINLGYVSYARHYNKLGTFAAGMHYINYGKFIEALENGQKTGATFTAGDYALNLIWSRNILNHFDAGINIKPVYSVYEMYSSFGLAADIGLTYTDSTGHFTAGMVLKNAGIQFSTYTENGTREPLPFDLQLGFSQRFAHAPFRLCFTFQRLTEWNLTDKSTWDYDNKDVNDYVDGRSDDFLRQFMRHMIFGVEFIPTKNFNLSFGYNFQRRRELAYSYNDSPIGLVGLSGGLTVKVSKFRFSYAIASYHLAGTSNTFSITTRLSDFMK